MDFLDELNLDDSQKEEVEAILEEDDLNAEEKLALIENLNLDDDDYEKIRKFVENDNEEEEEEDEEESTDFMALIEQKKQKVAQFYLQNEKIDSLRVLVSKQSDPECTKRFEEFLKQREPSSPVKQNSSPVKGNGIPAKQNSSQAQQNSRRTHNKYQEDDEESVASESEDEADTTALDTSEEEQGHEEEEHEEEDDTPQWKPNIAPDFFDRLPPCLNILVLGETGVGKSTFINGLANYLKYNNMYEAKDRGVEILIRSSFLHVDEDASRIPIESEPTIETEEENENIDDGHSSTQNPKAYQFDWGPTGNRKTIRIIDTPGVGDTRGPEQESLNFAKILSFIADYSEIHAILILLKPNEARLTVNFRYCITELLTHLHVSASKNILFCFTNARQTLYQPGETLPALRTHLEKLYKERRVRIPLQRDTLYFFDNESFRFLCAWRQGITFNPEQIEDFNTSWKKTVGETFRLFKKISELPIHNTEETLSINNIRQVILAMARPLAEIAKNQMTNTQLIDEKVKEVENLMKQGKTLRNTNLYVDQVTLTAKELDYPVTVCTSEGCVEMVRLKDDVVETSYKQKCHPHCYLEGIQTGIAPNPQIQKCACFNGNIQQCTVCRCDWTTHLHIRYELTRAMEKVQDQTVQDSVANCDDKVKSAQLFVDAQKKRRNALEAEAQTIAGHCAEFAAFLKKHSIIPYNDVYMEYVEHLIKEENGKINQGGSKKMLTQLQKHRDEYAAHVQILASHGAKATSNKSLADIYAMLDELRNMKNCGALLRDIENLEMLGVRKEQINRVTAVNIKKGWMDKMYKKVSNGLSSSSTKPKYNNSEKKPGSSYGTSRR